MKQFRFTWMLFSAAAVFLTSCNGGGKKTDKDTAMEADNAGVNVEPASNTIINTPQSMMTAVHKVANFAKWKASYDAHDSMRLANQIHSYIIGRGVQDSNMVLVVVKVGDMDKAKAFAKDASLKMAMQKGGVTGTPSFSFITITFQDTSPVDTDIRSRVTFQVKDWDTWLKAFEEGKQNRLDNGIIVRAYGHDVDDNHKVVVVTAQTDTAKANAYWNSDVRKNRMVAAGVIGEPERFVYRLTHRY
ncbi:hypothetical protein EGT74_05855 [Chitinophaga lutea]|uniref:Uncharacterized protein n=1 Tax=Chitinophaga lutea TaxID=2488634 RepID=A0A3N4PYM5_9BACT|nr:hypothetical protein [Chitinophaga lutea]RPE13058.1 hypothetical protein EGT74_05855 [Chitinophaga lutea]